jgi:hypothetical protein
VKSEGTHAGIGLGRRVYAQVCPIYHEQDKNSKKNDVPACAQQDEPDASLQ